MSRLASNCSRDKWVVTLVITFIEGVNDNDRPWGGDISCCQYWCSNKLLELAFNHLADLRYNVLITLDSILDGCFGGWDRQGNLICKGRNDMWDGALALRASAEEEAYDKSALLGIIFSNCVHYCQLSWPCWTAKPADRTITCVNALLNLPDNILASALMASGLRQSTVECSVIDGLE